MSDEREIWFEKAGWGYVPRHWKGVAVMVAVILPTIFAFYALQLVLRNLGMSGADVWPLLVVIPGWIAAMVIAGRHS